MFWKYKHRRQTNDNLKFALTKWKFFVFKIATTELKYAQDGFSQSTSGQVESIANIKAQNCKNMLHYFNKRFRNKVWKAWVIQRKQQRIRTIQNQGIGGVLASVKQKRALQKWYMRVQETQRIRARWNQLQDHYRIRMKAKVWEVLQFKQSVNYTMAITLSNLEYALRTRSLDYGFKSVVSYSTSKGLSTTKLKRRAAYDVMSQLTMRH